MIYRVLNRQKRILLGVLALGIFMGAGAAPAAGPLGKQTYNQVCIGCHQIGILGAPKFKDASAWRNRLEKGIDALVQNALNGFGKMPPKGGNPNLGEKDLRAAILYMAGDAGGGVAGKSSSGKSPRVSKRGEEIVKQVCKGCHEIGVLGAPRIGDRKSWALRLKKGEDTLVRNAAKGIGNMPPKGGNATLNEEDLRAAIRFMINTPTPKIAEKKAAAPQKSAAKPQQAAAKRNLNVNRFNRLMQPKTNRNLPPAQDGIHDPENGGTATLQAPREAFAPLPKSNAGNYVDWVKSLRDKVISPHWDLADPSKKPLLMDLNIVREVKGSMPDVVYPHKQHLQWLDCSNCHPKIFQPKKGANQISMAEIILGRKCGVCHGKVAFPVAECRRCHSKKKTKVVSR